MSWLSKLVKRNTGAARKVVGKIAAPLAVGALAIPGVGPAIAAGVGALGRLVGKAATGGTTTALGAITSVVDAAKRPASILDSLPGVFGAGVAAGSGADQAATSAARSALPWLAGCAGVVALLLLLRGRAPSRPRFRR